MGNKKETAQEVPVSKEYMVTINEDGTESRKLIREIYPTKVPSKEELHEADIRHQVITAILCTIIIVIVMYNCFKL